ncbi:MAG: beta-propeller repeat protein [Betaproteobacteria bacterium]|nr:beta-propeller repeat protein [Betaproteobacteria bacterium]
MKSKTHSSRRLNYLSLALTLAAAPAVADTARIYVTNSAGDSVHVIDPVTNKVVQEIKGIEASHGVAFSPDGKLVYISNESESTLDIVDQKSGKILKHVPLSGRPNNLAVTPDGKRIVVAITEPGTLDIIDARAQKLSKTIPMTGRLHNTYVTPDGKYAVSGSVRNKFMNVVDLATDKTAWEISFDGGVRPMAIEKAADGSTSRVFVQLSNLHGFAVVDFNARKEVARIKFPDSPNGYGSIEGRVGAGVPSHGIGIAPDGKSLWANSHVANGVFAYSLPDLKPLGFAALPDLKLAGRDPIGAIPDWVTFTPDSKTIYVGNSTFNSVSAIDMKTMKVVAQVPVGQVPKRMGTLVMR